MKVEDIQSIIDNVDYNVKEDLTDGYHSFKELYEFRKMYNATLFNEWASQDKYDVHKSLMHNDGELCFGGGYFIVVAMLPSGQITNHYPLSDWDLFQVTEFNKARYEFDNHTPQDVLIRMNNLIKK